MKNKMVLALLMALTISLAGCGSKASETPANVPAAESAEEAEEPETPAESEAESEEPEVTEEPKIVYEEVSFDVCITKVNEDGTMEAHSSDQSYLLSLEEGLAEVEKALLTAGASVTVTAVIEEGTEFSGEVITVPVSKAALMDEAAGYELSQEVSEKILGYSVEDMAETTMFAKSSVNVRSGPAKDYEKVGGLSTAQEVKVTGLTNTNWYRIKYKDTEAFVSASYLVNEKPVVQVAQAAPSQPSGGGASSKPEPTLADAYLVYSSADMDAAFASGDMATYNMMLDANVAAYDAKFNTNINGSDPVITNPGTVVAETPDAEKTTSLSYELFDLLNAKRREEGLPELEWSDSMAGTAMERAEEIVSDFSHKGSRNCDGENIHKSNIGDPSSWFNAFYNSGGHRVNMMSEGKQSVACAVCKCGSFYYVVMMLSY